MFACIVGLQTYEMNNVAKRLSMSEKIIDLATWPRTAQYHWFRAYDRPHYATTTRLDVTHLVKRRADAGVSIYRASLFAISRGLQAVPELRMRFRADAVALHDTVRLSMPVPNKEGSFNYAYVLHGDDFVDFDAKTALIIDETAQSNHLNPVGNGEDDVVFLSCMPWLDYTSITNAMPSKNDCTPRVTWGKYVQEGDRWRMAMTLEVHHALVDGAQVGAFFDATQVALNGI